MKRISLPITAKEAAAFRAGDSVLLSGTIYTARDRAHQLMKELLENGRELPIDLDGAAVYYCGPCPAPPGRVIGSCGPTSATRMDPYAPLFFDRGVRIVIAKGPFAPPVTDAIRRNGALYLCATGGAGALLADCVESMEECAFPELGTESIKRLIVRDMPLIVGIDTEGRSLFNGGEQ
ncbi:MAG: TRZ/ATZ family protein [Clostridia bacterium]|nr:TRZ/ATZ family protein [Clostridia bacterium]